MGNESFEEAIANRIVDLLNEMLDLDREATEKLVLGEYVPCNSQIANHRSIQARQFENGKIDSECNCGIRILGVLNGLISPYPDGYGRICAFFESVCKEHGRVEDGRDERAGDPCPECGNTLEIGALINFGRIPPEDHGIDVSDKRLEYCVYDPRVGMIFVKDKKQAAKRANEIVYDINCHKIGPVKAEEVCWGKVEERVELVALDEYALMKRSG